LDILAVNKSRIQSIDLLRGLVMIIMALDHVRDFFHANPNLIDPTDLTKTTVPLFLTRWITHFCAPVFMFLSGTSAYIAGQRKTKKQLSIFLLTRGLWLIFLELTIIGFGWSFQLDIHHFFLQVIWALGASMIVLSGLIWLPFNAILVIGLLLVCGHNALDNLHVQGNSIEGLGWKLLHEQGDATLGAVNIFVMYPIMPWIGVMALGYCLGKLYSTDFDAGKRKKILTGLGLSAIALFIALRFSNLYGDHSHWSSQPIAAFTLLSFLNCTKYPPSLLYLTMTLGPALLFLAYTENIVSRFSNIIKIYGRVPMFYYLCHLYLIHLGAILLFFIQGFKPSDFDNGLPNGYGVNLGMTYVVWITIIIILYFPCKWYDRYKSNHRENKWLSYL
jgi:uncharacterized membrane protein